MRLIRKTADKSPEDIKKAKVQDVLNVVSSPKPAEKQVAQSVREDKHVADAEIEAAGEEDEVGVPREEPRVPVKQLLASGGLSQRPVIEPTIPEEESSEAVPPTPLPPTPTPQPPRKKIVRRSAVV